MTLAIRRGLLAAVLNAAVVSLLAACGSTGGGVTGPSQSYQIATGRPAEAYPKARVDTTLHGESNPDGTACFWIGDAPNKSVLFWPHNYSAHGNPPAVFDASDRKVGAVGDYVTLGGGYTNEGHILGCPGVNMVFEVAP